MCYVMNHGDIMPCATVVNSTLAVPHRVPQAAEGEEERKSSLIEKKKKKNPPRCRLDWTRGTPNSGMRKLGRFPRGSPREVGS